MQDRHIETKNWETKDSARGTDRHIETKAEDVVRNFYDKYGWVKDGTESGEDMLFRKFPDYYYSFYEKSTFERTKSCFDDIDGNLLIVGCGDMPDNHIAIAERFREVDCIDISKRALEAAEEKMGDRAHYTQGSILNAPYPERSFDAVLCAHVLYHIDAEEQSKAVSEMARLTKPGGKAIIIYSNPNSIFAFTFWKASWPGRLAKRLLGDKSAKHSGTSPANKATLYFFCHPLRWWRQFERMCRVHFVPWDIMGSKQARMLLRGRIAPILVYRAAAWLERLAPGIAVALWQYPVVILEKKADVGSASWRPTTSRSWSGSHAIH